MDEDISDEIEICRNVEPHEDENSIKSKAVVKFSSVQVPANFNRLQCNTDLNLPPSNWLSTSPNSCGLHQALYHSPGFASFRMGHMFPDCVGDVDVVSDAENIKKLLKLPYLPKSAVSMIVHKVGNTLLIDEFDIQRYLLRKAGDDWQWLRTFIIENILNSLGEKERNICLKDKSREAIQTKNLLSKFLYYSLQQSGVEANRPVEGQLQYKENKALPITGPLLPEPNVEENVPDPKTNHVFNRNVVWTFEDIRMLIGTDMPIFGGPNRPCISLRLRDMNKPINVLTGIDYWLDNLMCNVPEVVMCYHLDGIVQKYEIIKTEDLPYLEDSQFSPQRIRNVAQNILAFLKANATKAGHTYWLFKGKNDEVVKLYDLTTLCNNSTDCDPKYENPFTVPVAMLLYTVARNMKNTAEKITAKKAGTICSLLDNCIKLLPKEKYPQIVTSSHYILSDLHIPAGIDPKSPKFDVSDVDSDCQSMYDDDIYSDIDSADFQFNGEDDEESEEGNDNVAVQSLSDTLNELNHQTHKSSNRQPLPLVASTEERCITALNHISEGISCLQYFNSNEEEFIKESEQRAKEEEKQRILHEEQHPNMAKPFQPIPLPYKSLNPEPKQSKPDTPIPMGWDEKSSISNKHKKKPKVKQTKLKTVKEEASVDADHTVVARNFNTQSFGSWNVHLKLLLLEKACLTYATLAEHNYNAESYGTYLKCIYMAFRCQQVVIKYMNSITSQKSCLLGRAGDCLFQMASNYNSIELYLNQYGTQSDIDLNILGELENDFDSTDVENYIFEPLNNLEHLLLTSCKSYEIALESASASDRLELLRRLGNVRNELGLKYMHWTQEEYEKYLQTETEPESDDNEIQTEPIYQLLLKKSYDSLSRGILVFEEVQDNVNLAFLLCNMGRFMRLRAYVLLKGERKDMKSQKRIYNEAFSKYERAKMVLGSRKKNVDLWDLVNWELSTATFELAKQMQDCSVKNEDTITEIVEKEVVELLQKSLTLCDVEHPGSRHVLYTYRSGLVHKRLASFHHAQVRANISDPNLYRTSLQLCRNHYEKAANILESLNEANDYLTVQLERIALQETLADASFNNNQKIKAFQTVLEFCLQSQAMIQLVADKSIEPFSKELYQHLTLLESRLQNALKNLIKLCMVGKDPKNLATVYKTMYLASLNVKKCNDEGEFANRLLEELQKIADLDKK